MHCAQADVRVLLVGVGVYPYLAGKNLDGPANDLRLMRSAVRQLAVPADNVTELSEAAGPEMLPTRANILAALDSLARQSGPGDWAMVYFSGHGAQVPQTLAKRRAHPEADGLDEVFLPRDTQRWVPSRGVVEGAIVDDELGAVFDKIRARGAQVWAIFDTCHAGDMTRGDNPQDAGHTVWRFVRSEDLGLPAGGASTRVRRGGLVSSSMPAAGNFPKPLPALVRAADAQTVSYFASQSDEPAAEELFVDPADGQTRRRFGVFTYHLHAAMAQWTGSFEALASAVQLAYRDRPFPTPQFLGNLAQCFPAVSSAGLAVPKVCLPSVRPYSSPAAITSP